MSSNVMLALVARGGRAQLEERAIPIANYGEVVVRTTTASMCSADPAGVSGSFDAVAGDDPEFEETGLIIGHESVGTVHEIGAGVNGFAHGDRVVSVSTTPCGQCENCQRGFGGHCSGVMWGGYSPGVTRDGTLAEYFVVPHAAVNLAKIPDAVSDADAVFVTDSLATGSSAVEGASLPLGGVVVIFGQGHVGLGATAAARVSGAGLVITVRSRPGGDDIARALGADISLNHRDHDVRAEILRLTDGEGVDLAVEASGAPAAFASAVEVTRLGGEVSVIATYEGSANSELMIPLAHWGWGVGDKNIRTRFQRSGSERTQRLLRLIERARIDPSVVFTHSYEFANVMDAFSDVANGASGLIKPLIHF